MKNILTQKNQRLIVKLLFILYIIILSKLVFFKLPLAHVLQARTGDAYNIWYSVNLIPFRTILNYMQGFPHAGIAFKNLLGNIVMFVPFGFLLPLLARSISTAKKLLLYSFAFSFFLELSQLFLRLGSFDVDDLLLNTLGAWLGYLLLRTVIKYQKTQETSLDN